MLTATIPPRGSLLGRRRMVLGVAVAVILLFVAQDVTAFAISPVTAGATLWAHRYDGPGGGIDVANAITPMAPAIPYATRR